jgi:hypothetical protein
MDDERRSGAPNWRKKPAALRISSSAGARGQAQTPHREKSALTADARK